MTAENQQDCVSNALRANVGDFGSLAQEGDSFFLRVRTFIDVRTGKTLSERRQQKILIAKRDNSLYKSIEKSSALHVKADQWRAQITKWEAAALGGNEIPPSGDMLVSDYFKNVFIPALRTLVATKQIAAVTLHSYERYWKMFLQEHFNGSKTLRNYQAYMGRQFLENLRKDDGTPYGENTVKKIHSVASGVFTDAVDRNFIDHNPWRDIKRAKLPKISAEQGVAYSETQVETMIRNLNQELGGQRDANVKTAQVALALGFWAGLRPSEMIALQWQNVDLDAGTITVCESIVRKVHADRTKTSEDRIVHYLSGLTPILRRWKVENGDPTTGFVLKGYEGGVIDLNKLSERIIWPNCSKNGIGDLWKGTAFYGCRRGCATTLAQSEATPLSASKFLGNTIAVFEKNYVVDDGTLGKQATDSYEQGKQRKAAEELERLEKQTVAESRDELAGLGLVQ